MGVTTKMHRAYQPITAANNKLLKKRWDQRSYDLHRSKVANSKSVIDSQPPDTYMHIHLKLKKLQVEEERLAVVERDNRILLEKMSWIMRTKGQRELLRVSHENQAILRRISSKEPYYNHFAWDEDWSQNNEYMSNISNYPRKFNPIRGPRTSIRKHQQKTL